MCGCAHKNCSRKCSTTHFLLHCSRNAQRRGSLPPPVSVSIALNKLSENGFFQSFSNFRTIKRLDQLHFAFLYKVKHRRPGNQLYLAVSMSLRYRTLILEYSSGQGSSEVHQVIEVLMQISKVVHNNTNGYVLAGTKIIYQYTEWEDRQTHTHVNQPL